MPDLPGQALAWMRLMGCPVRPEVTAAICDSLYTAAMALRISCTTSRDAGLNACR